MSEYTAAVNRHYGDIDLCARIDEALRAAGKDPDALTRDDCAPFDEFHGGGRESTRALARIAGLGEAMEVLDVGCGIGGPARTLAAEFGCRVAGLDLTEAFCAAAEMLTERLGMTDRVRFENASALEVPFEDAAFDAAWSQNMIMNIEDKARLFAEIHRVLRPGGIFALEGIVTGEGGDVLYPVMWSDTPELSFVVSAEALRDLVRSAGFVERDWRDTSQRAVETARKRLATMRPDAPPPLGINLLVTRDFARKLENGVHNIIDRRITPVLAVFEKAG